MDFFKSSVDIFDTEYYLIMILNLSVGLTVTLTQTLIANSMIQWPIVCLLNLKHLHFNKSRILLVSVISASHILLK